MQGYIVSNSSYFRFTGASEITAYLLSTVSVNVFDGTNSSTPANVADTTNRSVDVRAEWGLAGTTFRGCVDSTCSTPSAYDGTAGVGGAFQFGPWLTAGKYVSNIRLGASTTACDR
jgi:hypothetical protein